MGHQLDYVRAEGADVGRDGGVGVVRVAEGRGAELGGCGVGLGVACGVRGGGGEGWVEEGGEEGEGGVQCGEEGEDEGGGVVMGIWRGRS